MRWLVLAALCACQFTPGAFGAGQDANDSRGAADAPSDGALQLDTLDSSPDAAPMGPPWVRRIDITDALVTGGPHTDFPLLVSLSTPWLKSAANGGDVARDDAFDVWFSLDRAGSTTLVHEVEAYDPVNGVLVAWCKLSLAADSVLYVHYGDPALTTDPTMPAGVWSNGFAAVAHFGGGGDSTGNNTATATALSAATGQIGRARLFDGADSIVDVGSNAAIDNVFTGGGTVEAWINPTSAGEGAYGRVFDKGVWQLLMDTADAPTAIVFAHNGASSTQGLWATPANSIPFGSWRHVAVVYDKGAAGNDPILYVNGVSVTVTKVDTPTGSMASDASSTLYVGNRSGSDRTFDGVLDEIRMSSGARSAGWIATEFANASNPSAFYTVSGPL